MASETAREAAGVRRSKIYFAFGALLLLSVALSVDVVVERVTIRSVQVDVVDLSLGMDFSEVSWMRSNQRDDLAGVIVTRELALEAQVRFTWRFFHIPLHTGRLRHRGD